MKDILNSLNSRARHAVERESGFTLIELLVVVSVLGVLVALLLPNLVSVRMRSRDAARKSDLNQLKTALRMYYNDFQIYPISSGGQIHGCGEGDSICPIYDGSFSTNNAVYLKNMPDAADFSYQRIDNGDSFVLSTVMENASDPDVAKSAIRCGITSPEAGYYYVCAD